MSKNKKIITIVSLVLVVAFVGVAALRYFKKPAEVEPPTVGENMITPAPTIDVSNVTLPEVETNPELAVDIDNQPINTPEEIEEMIAQEEEQGTDIAVGVEDIKEENKRIEEAMKEAEENPDVQPVPMQPVETIKPTPAPAKDSEGYIYTKEEAVVNFRTTYQKFIDEGSYNYTGAFNAAKEESNFTQELFDENLDIMMNHPYDSRFLPSVFDDYRKTGDIGVLITNCFMWIGAGGDDGEYPDRDVR